jgi:hypothetical protein
MHGKKFLFLFIAASLILTGSLLFAQDEAQAPAEPAASVDLEVGGAVPPDSATPDTQWIFGEVVSIDLAAKSLTVKYLDYLAQQEKEISFSADEKTSFENIKSLEEVKVGDSLSIDYIVSPDGLNLIKTLGVEAAEEVPETDDIKLPPEEEAVSSP